MEMGNYHQQFESQQEEELHNSIFALHYNPELQPVVCSMWIRLHKVTTKRQKKCVPISRDIDGQRRKITIRDSESTHKFDQKVSVISASEFSRLRGKSPDDIRRIYESDSRKKKKKTEKNQSDSKRSENALKKKNDSEKNESTSKKSKTKRKRRNKSKLNGKIPK